MIRNIFLVDLQKVLIQLENDTGAVNIYGSAPSLAGGGKGGKIVIAIKQVAETGTIRITAGRWNFCTNDLVVSAV
jgi:hypothetical protein